MDDSEDPVSRPKRGPDSLIVTYEGLTPEWCLAAARAVLRLESMLPKDP